MPIGITKALTAWRFQDNYVERLMDNATARRHTLTIRSCCLVLRGRTSRAPTTSAAPR